VAKTTLGIVLVADVLVILLFSVAFSLARQGLGHGAGQAGGEDVFVGLLREVFGSVLAGVVVGTVISLYLRFVKRELVVFAVVAVFATAAAAQALHFELLLSLLVAGFLVENVAPVRAEPLVETLHVTAVPVFVIFFAMAGAELRVQEFAALLPVVLLVVGGRGLALYLAGGVGARVSGAEPVVVSHLWTGLVSQAGVALGFATIVAQRLPLVGAGLETLTVGVIAVNQTLGPILFRWGLGRAGEIRER
jgi:Kef-type K+ transport system membrane component KefB